MYLVELSIFLRNNKHGLSTSCVFCFVVLFWGNFSGPNFVFTLGLLQITLTFPSEFASLSSFKELLKYLLSLRKLWVFWSVWRRMLLTCTKKLFKVALSEDGLEAKDRDFGWPKAQGDFAVGERGEDYFACV